MYWRGGRSLAASTLLSRLGDQISTFVHGYLAVVTRARGSGADFHVAAGEFVGGCCVDA